MTKSIDDMNYYEEYCISSSSQLKSITDQNGCVDQDLRIYYNKKWNPNYVKSLGNVIRINGHLNIDEIDSLGELKYIKSNLNYSGKKLQSLNQLEYVGGFVNLRFSSVLDLGNLKRVEGKLNLRDTNIKSLANLEYVGGDLFLSKGLKDLDFSNLIIKGKIRFWSNYSDTISFFEYDKTKFSNIHQNELILKKRCVTGEFIVRHCALQSDLNSFILKNINEYYKFLDKKLDELYGSHYSFFLILFNELKESSDINLDFRKRPRRLRNETYSKYLRRIQGNQHVKKYIKVKNKFKKKYNFSGYTRKFILNGSRFSLCGSSNSFIYFIENTIFEIFHIMVISLQNDFRVSKGLPKIGEGWVSETELLYLLKDKFPNEEIIHHGKPKWLGRQHVDIWFPKLNIGVEYQGKQHDEPVEFFGGEKGFKSSKERDERKKKLFKENNANLIEVRKGYKIDDIVININQYINLKNRKLN